MVSRLVRVQETSGSNPDTSTKKKSLQLFDVAEISCIIYHICRQIIQNNLIWFTHSSAVSLSVSLMRKNPLPGNRQATQEGISLRYSIFPAGLIFSHAALNLSKPNMAA